jgi:hypothetical protein
MRLDVVLGAELEGLRRRNARGRRGAFGNSAAPVDSAQAP